MQTVAGLLCVSLFLGVGERRRTSASQEDAMPKPSPLLTLPLASWSLGFLVTVAFACPLHLLIAVTYEDSPFLALSHPPTSILLSLLLHTRALRLHSTCPLTFSILLEPSCFHSGQFLSACSLQAVGMTPVPYRQPLQPSPALGTCSASRTQLAQPAFPSRSCWDGDAWLLFN